MSEASQRFERGVDPALADRAAARAAVLLARLGGGRIATGLVDHDRRPPPRPPVPLRLARAQLLTGTALTTASCEAALARLDDDFAGVAGPMGERDAGEARLYAAAELRGIKLP